MLSKAGKAEREREGTRQVLSGESQFVGLLLIDVTRNGQKEKTCEMPRAFTLAHPSFLAIGLYILHLRPGLPAFSQRIVSLGPSWQWVNWIAVNYLNSKPKPRASVCLAVPIFLLPLFIVILPAESLFLMLPNLIYLESYAQKLSHFTRKEEWRRVERKNAQARIRQNANEARNVF